MRTKEELKVLAELREGPHVTLWLNGHQTGAERQQGPIMLKNLATEAEKELIEQGMRPTEARDLLEPALALREDEEFWLHQPEGIGVFLSPGFSKVHQVSQPVRDSVFVMPRFYFLPLIDGVGDGAHFYVLALEKGQARFFYGSQNGLQEVNVPDMPDDIDAVIGAEYSEKQLQYHTTGRGRAGSQIHHGAGDRGAEEKNQILRYFEAVDRAVFGILNGQDAPLVLAMDAYMAPIYREASNYSHIIDEVIEGSPKMEDAASLFPKSWEAVRPILEQPKRDAIEKFKDAAGTGMTETQVEHILREAVNGRVATLFVDCEGERWGKVEADQSVRLSGTKQAGDEELINRAALEILEKGGQVFVLDAQEMPTPEAIGAIYRY